MVNIDNIKISNKEVLLRLKQISIDGNRDILINEINRHYKYNILPDENWKKVFMNREIYYIMDEIIDCNTTQIKKTFSDEIYLKKLFQVIKHVSIFFILSKNEAKNLILHEISIKIFENTYTKLNSIVFVSDRQSENLKLIDFLI